MPDKILWGYLSLFLVVVPYPSYVISMLARKTKPHVFTWVIWTLVTSIAAAAQYAGQAGPGAWATILTATFCVLITLLSFKYGEPAITRSDWISFFIGLSAIPLWYYTKNPLIAAVIATMIDASAYYPTFRKSHLKPQEEMMFLYIVGNAKHITSILAITTYSVTTLLFPATLFVMNASLILMLLWRRAQLKSNTARH